jgi:hypothetical protein
MYDPISNTWSAKASMPTARNWAAGAAAGGRFFVMGGYTGTEEDLGQLPVPLTAKVEAYTP